jgi:hypothetical protein
MRFIDISSARAESEPLLQNLFQELFPDNSIEKHALSRKKASSSRDGM